MQINRFTNVNVNTESQSVMKASISLAVAAMLLTASLAVPAAAQKQVPFKGAMQGREIDTPQGGPPLPRYRSTEGPGELLPWSVNSHSPIKLQ